MLLFIFSLFQRFRLFSSFECNVQFFFVQNSLIFYQSFCFFCYVIYTQIWLFLFDNTLRIDFLYFLTQKAIHIFLIGSFFVVIIFLFSCFQLNSRRNMALTPDSFSIILLFILPIFLIMEASAGENFISAATTSNEDQIVPFNQLIEHSFNKNYKGYNELAKAHNVGSYLGKNASSLNSEHPFLNSHNLIHQVFLASKTISPNTVVSTDAYTKYEVAYLSKNQLTMHEVLELLNKFHAPHNLFKSR